MFNCDGSVYIFTNDFKLLGDIMKKILAVIEQFIIEIVILLSGVINFIENLVDGHSLLFSIINVLVSIEVLWFCLSILRPLIYRGCSKKMCNILHLTKWNEISMIPQKVQNENDFLNDIEKIVIYAQNKKIKSMYTKTHKIMVLYFLVKYTTCSKKEIFDMISKMKLNSHLHFATSFGSVKVIYIGKKINNCNRYNKKGLSKITETKDTYKMKLNIR